MKLSVITVVRNAEATIEATILSVVNQTFTDYEYLIIDGVSTDNTLNVIKKYSDKITTVISEEDTGIYDAMNKASKIAKGEWIYFLGADDVLYNNDTLANLFNNDFQNAQVVYGNVKFKLSEIIYAGEFDINKICLLSPCHQAVFYQRDVLIKYQLFDTRYKINADYDLHLKTYKDGVVWRYFNQIICIYNDDGISSNRVDEVFRDDLFIKLFDAFSGKIDREVLCRICFKSFLRYCKTHKTKDILRYLQAIQKRVGFLYWIQITLIKILEKKGYDITKSKYNYSHIKFGVDNK